MRFYNNAHPYYCGIDLHARLLYVCIIDSYGEVIVHKKIGADKNDLLRLLEPYIGNVIVGVECMHCWYWVSDWCTELGVDFVLGHALYMKAILGGKTKTIKWIPSKLLPYHVVVIFHSPTITQVKCALLVIYYVGG